LTEVKS